MMEFTDIVDEVIALIMALAGVIVLVAGAYMNAIGMTDLSVENLLLIASALLGPSTGYIFGKSQPKKDLNIKDLLKPPK